ncbi:phosphotransferase [Terrabacter sp. 2RAF25]|uniref:phosphotransferase n=1 Tax=Terrabacter sp. 2RAF25 TaxID=3232998 RepID=UPI003F950DF7
MSSDAQAATRVRPLPDWATDPSLGDRLAREWVATHRPGRSVARARTHSLLYRGPGDVSARVGIQLDGDAAAEAVTLLVRDRGGDVSVAEFPDDRLLPTLAAVLRGGALAPLLRDSGIGRASATGPFDYSAVVVHHPREGACVLRVRVGEEEAYAKVYPRADDATAAAEALYAVGTGQVRSLGAGVVRLPRVLGVSPSLRTTVLESLTPPGAVGPWPGSPDPVGTQEVARVLRAFHAHAPTGRLRRVTASELVDRLRREQGLVATAWPDVAARVDAAVRQAASVLEQPGRSALSGLSGHSGLSGAEPVLCHGDFTPGQVVRVPGGLGVLDLDTVAFADPAADIGRFLAYAAMREETVGGSASRAAAARTDFLVAYGISPGAADVAGLEVRVWAHRRLNLARIALRATRRFKSARAAFAVTLLDTSDPKPGRLP